MISFLGSKTAVVLFADEAITRLGCDLQSITITRLVKSEGYFVTIVTATSLVDYVRKLALNFSKVRYITLTEITQAG